MAEFLVAAYPWTKALHVISVIAWMAGLLYLPRLFVYHAAAAPGSDLATTFATMEVRLLRAIMNPAMIAAYVFGSALLFTPGVVRFAAAWIWVKLTAIAALTILHHLFGIWRKELAAGRNRRSARFYRVVNELPAVAMVVIVFMVIVKPF